MSVENIATIQVQVTGEVTRPGAYAVNGMATVLNALYQAGGPTKSGTFRQIKLVRANQPDRAVDLYQVLMEGSKKQDYPLEDGDMLFVPPVGSTITVTGEVVRPGRYEPIFPLTLAGAIKMAGGTKASGYLQDVQVERIQNNQYRVLISQPVTNGASKPVFALQPGDAVTVVSVPPDRTNQVSISGPVRAPGIYGYKEGMKVADLLDLAQGISQDKEVYPARADVLRIDPLTGPQILSFNLDKALKGDPASNFALCKLDRVFIYQPDQVAFRPKLVTIAGAVARPGTYKRAEGMRVSDAVAAAGGTLPQAYLIRADLLRRKNNETTELVRIDLRSAMTGDPDANVSLQDRDELTIYTSKDVKWQQRTVRIEGAVQRPGLYTRSDNMHVRT